MNMTSLHSIGLSEDQILTYTCLLENGTLTPPQLAAITKESRTNAYMSLKKLESLGMAEREEVGKKLAYKPVSPARLEHLLVDQEHAIRVAREEFTAQLPDMLNVYYAKAMQPSVQFHEGTDALQMIHRDQLAAKQDVYIIRTPTSDTLAGDALYDYAQKRAEAGITTHVLSPKTRTIGTWAKKYDTKLKRIMVWVEAKQYIAPVEIAVYGTKVAYITYDEKIVTTIVDNPHISQAMRELFHLAAIGRKY